ncbi:MAG: moeZ1 [Frankiales bacterium]|nr:moeZ1 [Frankiales bacterium]
MQHAEEITAVRSLELITDGAILLDVREDHEWVAGHAPQAQHLPMSELAERTAEIPSDRTIICVCHVGGRSARVAAALNGAGWQALNLTGGMEAWTAAGLDVIDDSGAPGEIV